MASSRNKPSTDPVFAAIERCFGNQAHARQTYVVGLSGGMDSIVLLDALIRLAPRVHVVKQQIKALHINHGISPNAYKWERFCRTVCADIGIGFKARRVAVERGSSDGLENAARRARYEIFAKTNTDKILLAHHQDDQAETLLFNLLRGSGLRGAAGIPESRERVLRPLLGVGRLAIEEYARRHELSWVEDESNEDSTFTRNYIRHEVIPLLRRRFPSASASLAAAAGRFSEALGLLDELAVQDFGSASPCFPLSVAQLKSLSEPRARNLLRYLLAAAAIQIPSEERLREALRQLLSAGPDRHPAIRMGARILRRRSGWVVLE